MCIYRGFFSYFWRVSGETLELCVKRKCCASNAEDEWKKLHHWEIWTSASLRNHSTMFDATVAKLQIQPIKCHLPLSACDDRLDELLHLTRLFARQSASGAVWKTHTGWMEKQEVLRRTHEFTLLLLMHDTGLVQVSDLQPWKLVSTIHRHSEEMWIQEQLAYQMISHWLLVKYHSPHQSHTRPWWL